MEDIPHVVPIVLEFRRIKLHNLIHGTVGVSVNIEVKDLEDALKSFFWCAEIFPSSVNDNWCTSAWSWRASPGIGYTCEVVVLVWQDRSIGAHLTFPIEDSGD